MADANRFGLKPETLKKLSAVFKRHRVVQQVLIYGSRAKGNYRNESDIDLTLKGDDLQWSDMQIIEQEIDGLMLPYKIDLSIFSQINNEELRRHIERWGISL